MKAVLAVALILICCLSADAQKEVKPKGKVAEAYDRFKNVTTVSLHVQISQGWSDVYAPTLMAIFTYPGTQFQRPDKIFLGFSSDSKTWVFLEDWQRSFIALTENKRIDYGTMRRVSGSAYLGGVLETAGLWVTAESYLELAMARTAEIQLGRTIYKLKPEYLLSLKEFAKKADLQPSSSTASTDDSTAKPESKKPCYEGGRKVPCP